MKFLAVDGNSIINRAFYGVPLLSNKKGVYTNAILGFMNIILKVIDEETPSGIIIAFDRKEKTFRHEMFDDYKAGRKSMPEELAMQLPILKDLLHNLGYTVLDKEGYEADDILGTIGKMCENNKKECILLSGDRDSLQLVSDYTTVILPTTKNKKPIDIIYNKEKIKEDYGVTPEGMIEIKALMGDASDNIPGVKGIGEVTAKKLISDYGSIDYIYNNIDSIKLTPTVKRNLENGKENAMLSKELGIIIKDVPIKYNINENKKENDDKKKAVELLQELEMFSLINRLNLDVNTKDIESSLNKLNNISKKELSEFLKNNEEVFFIVNFKEDIPVSFYASGKKDFFSIDEENNNLLEFLNIILLSKNKIITTNSKAIYRYGFLNNLNINIVEFDVTLSGYILNPLATSYELSRLAQEHLGIMPKDEYEDFEQLNMLMDLFLVFNKLISDNDQHFILYDVELPLAKVLASMEVIGFDVDEKGIEEFGNMLTKRIEILEKNIYKHAGVEFNINSPKQLGEILFDTLGLPVIKKTKTGYSTNADVLDKLMDKHPIIAEVLDYRQLAKLNSTYVEGFLKVIEKDGRIHSRFNQTKTRTGRISSTEPNLQNIPVRTELGREMRKFFRAKDGCQLVMADYSQIELRVLAHIADDKNMKTAFTNKEDIHTTTASQVFLVPMDMVTKKMRSDSKAVNFGIVYGISAFSLSKDIGVSVKDAQKYIDTYLNNFSGVKQYMLDTVSYGMEHGYVKTLFDRRRDLPELKSKNYIQKSFGERVALNMPIQGTAADIIKIAMVKVFNRLKEEELKSKLILQIHDELIIETYDDEVKVVETLLKEEMEAAANLSVPLIVDVQTGPNWYETKD